MTTLKHSEAARANQKKCVAAFLSRRVTLVCVNCRQPFMLSVSVAKQGRKACSWKCRKEFMVGSNAPNAGKGHSMRGTKNPNYKSGASVRGRAALPGARSFRRLVLNRDGHKCLVCGGVQDLHAHHLDEFAVRPLFVADPQNGITLCRECHQIAHGKSGCFGFFKDNGDYISNGKREGRYFLECGSMRCIQGVDGIRAIVLSWNEMDNERQERTS